ncbi:MAG TPA: MbcA/ParS/Xre antitoxin family protein [Casimicrobiaceae bacterium]|nr:MbcA/ParS/Xre antitoxin family protein [Casimicrobiaceae bacterium]
MTETASRSTIAGAAGAVHARRRTATLDWGAIDALALGTLQDRALLREVRRLERLELASVWTMTKRSLLRRRETQPAAVAPLEMHQRVLEGLGGESLLVSASMFLDTLQETEHFFHLSFKTLKSKLGRTLDTAESELALRAARAMTAAAEVLGSFETARRYMRTRNFALGGAMPMELLQTAEGERLVLNELQAQADGGPL